MKPSGTTRMPPPAAPRRPRRPVASYPLNLWWEGAHLGASMAGGDSGLPTGLTLSRRGCFPKDQLRQRSVAQDRGRDDGEG